MRKYQTGLSLIGMLLVGSLLAFVLIIGFKTVPAVSEYFAVRKVIFDLAEEGSNNNSGVAALRKSFDRRAQIDDISTITGRDLDIFKRNGVVVVEVEYERKVPIVGIVGLYFEFNARSDKAGL